jgi:hypothetical protein
VKAPDHRYSTFALDVHWASKLPPDAEMAEHIEECARCRSYIDGLRVLGALPILVVPAAAVAPPKRTMRHRPWLLAAAGLVAIVGAALWKRGLDRGHRDDAEKAGYVATKSAPAAQVLVRRAGQTSVWDGRSPLRPGDALALRVACESMRRVSILVPSAASWTRLSEGACPAQEPLPFTLVVDAQPGEERLAVVFSRTALDDAAARRASDRTTRSADVWTLVLVFAKSIGAP